MNFFRSYVEYVVCMCRQLLWAKPLRPAKPQRTRWVTGYLCRNVRGLCGGIKQSANTQTQQTVFFSGENMKACCFSAASRLCTCIQAWGHGSIVRTHTHTHTDSTGPLIMSNPVLLLAPHSSHVLLAHGWLCSLCIYLSVVRRLHAVEIKSKGQRAGGDECIVELSGYVCSCTYPPGKHRQDQTS